MDYIHRLWFYFLKNGSLIASLFPLYLVIFIGFLGYSLMITIFTPMLLYGQSGIVNPETAKASRTIILGVLLSLYPFGQFIGSPILGALSDHWGRKRLLIGSLILVIFLYVFLAISLELMSLWLMILSCFFMGLFEGNIAIAQSAIADLTDEKNRARYFGYIYISASFAYIVGPLLGGFLANPNIRGSFDYALPFWGVIILLVLALFWVCIKFEETTSLKRENPDYFKAFTNLFTIFSEEKNQTPLLCKFPFLLGHFWVFPMLSNVFSR